MVKLNKIMELRDVNKNTLSCLLTNTVKVVYVAFFSGFLLYQV